MTLRRSRTARLDLPPELAEQLDALVPRLAATVGQYVHVDREVALRIALARGIEALAEDGKSPLA